MYAIFPRWHLRVHLFALPIAALVIWLEGLLPAALLVAAALLHEMGHLLAIRLSGVPVRRVDIEPMGALIVYDDSVCPLNVSMRIAFAGAGMNLLIAAVTLPFALHRVPLLFFALANICLAVLNLLPWEKLDGGRLLLNWLLTKYEPDKCERICERVSRVSLLLVLTLLLSIGTVSAFPLWNVLLTALLLASALL